MKINLKLLILSMAVFCVLVFSSKVGYAYIDPGTGSMIVQAVIAAVAATSLTVGIFWRRLKEFFRRFFGRKRTW